MPNRLPVRERSDSRIAGVCAALARAWAVDPLLLRVAFVVVAVLTSGLFVLAYLALWAILPERGSEAPLHQWFPSTRSWPFPSVVTTAVLVTVLLGSLMSGSGPGAFVVLGLAWIILRFGFARRESARVNVSPPPLPQPLTPFQRSAQAWQQRLDNVEAGRPADWIPDLTTPALPPVPAPAPGPAARSRVGRGGRTWLGILVGLVVAGGALAAASALGVVVPALAWVSAALLVLGLALVWTARPGRAAWGRPVLLLPLAVVTALATVPMLVPPQVVVSPPTVSLVDDPAGGVRHLPPGTHTIDLTDRSVADETVRYKVDLGDLSVVVPRTGNVVVHAVAMVGDVTVPGEPSDDGIDVRRTWSRTGAPGPTLTIEVSTGLGEVKVLTP